MTSLVTALITGLVTERISTLVRAVIPCVSRRALRQRMVFCSGEAETLFPTIWSTLTASNSSTWDTPFGWVPEQPTINAAKRIEKMCFTGVFLSPGRFNVKIEANTEAGFFMSVTVCEQIRNKSEAGPGQ